MSDLPNMQVRFDPIREVCRNHDLSPYERYRCVFAHEDYTCTNTVPEARKLEAIHLAAKLQLQPAKDISWADLWKFITDVHCVHHFDEAVNFELPYALEILAALLQEQKMLEDKQRRLEEWEAELRRGEEREDSRRRARRCIRIGGNVS